MDAPTQAKVSGNEDGELSGGSAKADRNLGVLCRGDLVASNRAILPGRFAACGRTIGSLARMMTGTKFRGSTVLAAGILVAALTAFVTDCSHAPDPTVSQQAMDRDLMEVTVPQLEQLYAAHKYTVTEV